MKKSRRPARAADAGTIRRGKYIFVIKFALPTRLFPEDVTAFAK